MTPIVMLQNKAHVRSSPRSWIQSHQARVFWDLLPRDKPVLYTHATRLCHRFVPRHDDELELEVDDPLLVEVQSEDYWYEGYNMRTGTRGIFPAYYAIEVTRDPEIYRGKTVRGLSIKIKLDCRK